uniref:PDR9 n=1 Tax=Arundo donax TaxID=35708 RepID=A0A0A9AYE4_ARUDO
MHPIKCLKYFNIWLMNELCTQQSFLYLQLSSLHA